MEKKKDQSKGNVRENDYDQEGYPATNAPDPMNGSLFSVSPKEDDREKATKKGHFADDENEKEDKKPG